MRVAIVAVDQRLPSWAAEACGDYLSRFPRNWRVEVRTVREEPRRGQTREKLMEAEASRIRKALPQGAVLVCLDERGRDMTTEAFARQMRAWEDAGRTVAFVIGGADGLDATLKAEASTMVRLSSMTLPHAFARVMLCEQVYRAWSLLNNHPYHRA